MRGEGEGLCHRQEVVQELGVTALQLAVFKISPGPSHWQIINYISATTDEETIDFMRYAQCILKRLRDFKP